MTNQEEFEYFVEQLLNNAVKEFKETEQYKLLREKLDRMDTDCETMLNPDERGFVTECFELILEAGGQEGHYAYRQGLLDCVKVLKWLGCWRKQSYIRKPPRKVNPFGGGGKKNYRHDFSFWAGGAIRPKRAAWE